MVSRGIIQLFSLIQNSVTQPTCLWHREWLPIETALILPSESRAFNVESRLFTPNRPSLPGIEFGAPTCQVDVLTHLLHYSLSRMVLKQ